MSTEATEEQLPDEFAAMFSLDQKKKKKSSKKKTTEEAPAATTDENAAPSQTEGEAAPVGVFELDPPIYTYEQLLNRVVDFVHQNNPELADKKRFTMKPPQLMRGKYIRI